jgi:hypothetical protein
MTPANSVTVNINWRFSALLVAAGVIAHPVGALATNVETASLNVDHGVTTLAVESARPIATAVQALVDRFGVVITYEDPRYAYKGDLQDVTEQVRKDLDRYPPGRAPRVIVPKGGKLTVKARSADVAAILEQLIRVQSTTGQGGHFRVEHTGDAFHVVPTESRDRDGNWAVNRSILDIPISLPIQDRAYQEMIAVICKALSAAAHTRIWIGSGVGGGLMSINGPPQYRLGANNEPARSVLMRALTAVAADRGKLTWVLFYGDDSFALSILTVPDQHYGTGVEGRQ